MLKRYTMLVLLLVSAAFSAAQTVVMPGYSSRRVDDLEAAIGRAEGYGIKRTIPSRYRNPGDLKATAGVRLPGQIGVGKGQHIIFRTDEDGKLALHRQLLLILAGKSKHYNLDMNINQVARTYAQSWQGWARRVSTVLHVSPRTTLRDLLVNVSDVDVPPVLSAPPLNFDWLL